MYMLPALGTLRVERERNTLYFELNFQIGRKFHSCYYVLPFKWTSTIYRSRLIRVQRCSRAHTHFATSDEKSSNNKLDRKFTSSHSRRLFSPFVFQTSV